MMIYSKYSKYIYVYKFHTLLYPCFYPNVFNK